MTDKLNISACIFICAAAQLFAHLLPAQTYPSFGPEHSVTISGLTFDAMEPFISPDGNTLFFNSLNSGGNTNLYYASRIDDTTFNYIGMVGGTYDSSANHLDGVASLDSSGNFFWVSLRNYPAQIDNLHRGTYSAGNVTDISRVHGDFNIPVLGWIIMDAGINYQGDQLIYCNAYFDFINNSCGAGIPCDARLGIALRVNDSTFNKFPNTDTLFQNVNDTAYLVYAPCVTPDGLELYYTRMLHNSFTSEICVSVRTSITDPFSPPVVIYTAPPPVVPEGPTLTTDNQKLYYHKTVAATHVIVMRYRVPASGTDDISFNSGIQVFPNPATDQLYIQTGNANESFIVEIYSHNGQLVLVSENRNVIDISGLASGSYVVHVRQAGNSVQTKIIR